MGCVLFLEKLFSVGMSAEAALVINPRDQAQIESLSRQQCENISVQASCVVLQQIREPKKALRRELELRSAVG